MAIRDLSLDITYSILGHALDEHIEEVDGAAHQLVFENGYMDAAFYSMVLTCRTWLHRLMYDIDFFEYVYIETWFWATVRFQYRAGPISLTTERQSLGSLNIYRLLHADLEDVMDSLTLGDADTEEDEEVLHNEDEDLDDEDDPGDSDFVPEHESDDDYHATYSNGLGGFHSAF